MLVAIDGSKALCKAVTKAFGNGSPVQRCQLHKDRNAVRHLPPSYKRAADQRKRIACAVSRYADAKGQLLKTAE